MTETKINEELEAIKKTLSMEQLRFVDHYLGGETPAKAYELAGLALGNPSDDTECLHLLKAPKIRSYIDAMQRAVTKNSIMSMDAIDQKLSEFATADVADMLEFGIEYMDDNGNVKTPVTLKPLHKLTKAQKQSITSIKTSDGGLEIKMIDKLKTLDMLIKRRAGYTERQEIKHTGNVQIVALVGNNNRLKQD